MRLDWRRAKKWIKEHLEKRFLFIIRNEETFEETASYRLTLKNIYILGSTLIFLVGLFLLMLIIFTPLKKYIPGYGDLRSQSEYKRLVEQIQALENNIQAREIYIKSIQRILDGNPETRAEVTKNVKIKMVEPEPEPKVKEDSLLRSEFEILMAREGKPRAQTSPASRSGALYSPDPGVYDKLELTPPVRGPLGAEYKPEKGHIGVDIIAAKNTPIKAMLDGTVIQSDWSIENGHTIAIQHSNNMVSIYKHNSALLKKTGVRVKSGEAIAIIGNTGTLTDGPHLHFELWFKGKPVNPVDYIRF